MKKGKYLTRCGHKAFVVQITSIGMSWVVKGAIECPKTKALVIASWDIYGRSDSGNESFNLIVSEKALR